MADPSERDTKPIDAALSFAEMMVDTESEPSWEEKECHKACLNFIYTYVGGVGGTIAPEPVRVPKTIEPKKVISETKVPSL